VSSISPAHTQTSRLERFGCTRTIDVHCHILPGVDDGPRNLSESLALCRALVHDGFTDAIATPHQLGRWDGANDGTTVRSAIAELQSQLAAAKIPLSVHPGGEVRLDERIPQLLGSGRILTLADTGVYLLLELPQGLNVDPAMLVPYLTRTGTRVVLAHAERYNALAAADAHAAVAAATTWTAQGAALQVNAASLVGGSGPQAEAAAWQWLANGLVALIATDAHSINTRRPCMSVAIEQIVARLGEDAARRTCIENPARVLEGRDLV
jgi:protein-tyrosine phosphatase